MKSKAKKKKVKEVDRWGSKEENEEMENKEGMRERRITHLKHIAKFLFANTFFFFFEMILASVLM